jgi:D-aspartate ligase
MRNQRPPKTAAFVLDLTTNGLGIARSLGREGITVIGLDFNPEAPGRVSRYCRPVIVSDPPDDSENTLKLMLRAGGTYREKGVLFPGSDEDVLLMSRYRDRLSECFLFSLPSEYLVESLTNKRRQYELAEKAGVPYPHSWFPQNLRDLQEIKDKIEYPVFIKPYYSHVWRNVFRNKGFKVRNSTELVEKFSQVLKEKLQAMVQSIIVGPDSNIVEVYAYLNCDHKPLATFVTRKLRQQPNEFGVGTCLESIHDKNLLEMGLRFLKQIDYVGLGSIELKKDNRDGHYKLLELNVRLAHHNIQATCAGVNFPLVQYKDLTGEPIDEEADYRDGVIWVDDVYDLLAAYRLHQKGELSWGNWLRSVIGAECHSYFAWDDLMPFLKDLLSELSILPNRYRGRSIYAVN